MYESQPYVLTPSRGSPQYSPATGLQTSRGKVGYVGLPSANDGKDPEPAAVVIAQDKLQELTSDVSVMEIIYLYTQSVFQGKVYTSNEA